VFPAVLGTSAGGEHLDDPAAGDAEESVLLAVVGGPHDDLVTLDEDVVDRPPLPHATDVVEQLAPAARPPSSTSG
jgi:hypothetical protein